MPSLSLSFSPSHARRQSRSPIYIHRCVCSIDVSWRHKSWYGAGEDFSRFGDKVGQVVGVVGRLPLFQPLNLKSCVLLRTHLTHGICPDTPCRSLSHVLHRNAICPTRYTLLFCLLDTPTVTPCCCFVPLCRHLPHLLHLAAVCPTFYILPLFLLAFYTLPLFVLALYTLPLFSPGLLHLPLFSWFLYLAAVCPGFVYLSAFFFFFPGLHCYSCRFVFALFFPFVFSGFLHLVTVFPGLLHLWLVVLVFYTSSLLVLVLLYLPLFFFWPFAPAAVCPGLLHLAVVCPGLLHLAVVCLDLLHPAAICPCRYLSFYTLLPFSLAYCTCSCLPHLLHFAAVCPTFYTCRCLSHLLHLSLFVPLFTPCFCLFHFYTCRCLSHLLHLAAICPTFCI